MDMDPFARMIAKAVQKHGMILWDISGVVGFRAENPANKYPDGHPFWKEGAFYVVRRGRTRPIRTIRSSMSVGRRSGCVAFLGTSCKPSRRASRSENSYPRS